MTRADMTRVLALATLILLPAAACAADRQAADACAAKLPAEAKIIYDTAAPQVRSDLVLRDWLPGVVRPLVMAGKVSRTTARDSGQAAGLCLKNLQ